MNLLTTVEVGQMIHKSGRAVRRRIREFPGALYDGHRWLVPESAVESYLARLRFRRPVCHVKDRPRHPRGYFSRKLMAAIAAEQGR